MPTEFPSLSPVRSARPGRWYGVCGEDWAAGLRGIEVEGAFQQVDEIVVIGIGEISGVSGVAAGVWACFPEPDA